ncbi:type I-E CRISPR-associated protein Cas6/Cse3/CasE [Shigella sonnei]|nr:type I-E CRISPR-associated protein Cas6/Cse3/CasE [Shigella sonnei]EFP7456644.1 type I-E CRISPR-associated protein Cas6/Cse3/CasE [Shigella sonnei]EFP7529753.1 type I-E CRISPR-associated protein Cas6/Cse3/CasE [Shigella sonnei]EFV6328860.1 type I-E CRISPR-associated protein Cas6/Cse3/CasE [Shigella sonnei]EFV9131720.1 type I-E CRISPR-associated protein Cas6/Cse3/CasE [Shigella sonnei]
MYLSRITLHTGQLSPAQLLHLVDRGEYVMHQWLWDLFPGGKERQFLYRREELQGGGPLLSCQACYDPCGV